MNQSCEQSPYSPLEPQAVTARRYRNSRYFLEDQLRCSQTVDDYRTIRSFANSLNQLRWCVMSPMAEALAGIQGNVR
ncbi:MAG: hypothetical protein IPK79_11280 [Vampirovibrionales bacterium]|nr:hypothetical protein [Vampirovibrionales bacterium]